MLIYNKKNNPFPNQEIIMAFVVKEFFYQPNGPAHSKEAIDLQITNYLQTLRKVRLIDVKYHPPADPEHPKTYALLICETDS